MPSLRSLRPLAAAVLFAVATGLPGVALAQKAEAVRPEVGKPLQAAQSLIRQKKAEIHRAVHLHTPKTPGRSEPLAAFARMSPSHRRLLLRPHDFPHRRRSRSASPDATSASHPGPDPRTDDATAHPTTGPSRPSRPPASPSGSRIVPFGPLYASMGGRHLDAASTE